jgi:hypothetical protein
LSSNEQLREKQWVVVSYPGKNKNTSLNFIGKIQDVFPETKLLKVMFVRKQPGTNVFKFPDVEDIEDNVPYEYVSEFLTGPKKNNRFQLSFPSLQHSVLK